MYMILCWVNDDDYLTAIKNEDDSIRLYDTLEEADESANALEAKGEGVRVISIEGVNE